MSAPPFAITCAREVAIFAAAAVAAVGASRFTPMLPRTFPLEPPPVEAGMTIPDPALLPPGFVSAVLGQRLSNGEPVLFGSSELAFDGETAPHLFFPKACGRSLLTIGREGYQSLPILLTLHGVEATLSEKSDVTVILSPGWFAEFGTASGAFLRYLRRDALRILFGPGGDPGVRGAVAREIADHRDEFTGLYPDWIFPWAPALANLTPPRPVDEPDVSFAPLRRPAADFDWDQAEATWRADAIAKAEGNPYGVEASYFARHRDDLPKRVHALDPFDVERQDLYALSTFLRARGVRARFVVQPLHRKVYRDLAAYDRRTSEALARLSADGHRVIDLGAEFDPQLLRDSVHFGGYGWVRVQREMCRR